MYLLIITSLCPGSLHRPRSSEWGQGGKGWQSQEGDPAEDRGQGERGKVGSGEFQIIDNPPPPTQKNIPIAV